MNEILNNKVYLQGEILTEPEFNHNVFNENFYSFQISVSRLSGNSDVLPVIISEKLMAVNPIVKGNNIAIRGQFRSHNQLIDGKSKLILSVFCRELLPYNSEENSNRIELSGYICKPPIYRTTPFSREICDLLLAVNRNYDKSDYIPCIAWGRNSTFVRELPIGSQLELVGRIQSRDYVKYEGEVGKTHTAYEVSIGELSLIGNAKLENA